jgi:hypothetical protein
MDNGPSEAAQYVVFLAQQEELLEANPPPPIPSLRADIGDEQVNTLLHCLQRRRLALEDEALLSLLGLPPAGSFSGQAQWMWRHKARVTEQSLSTTDRSRLLRSVRGAAILIALCHSTKDERIMAECAATSEALNRLAQASHPMARELQAEVDQRLPKEIQSLYQSSQAPSPAPPPPNVVTSGIPPAPSSPGLGSQTNPGNVLEELGKATDPASCARKFLRMLEIDSRQAAMLAQIAEATVASRLSALVLAETSAQEQPILISPHWQILGHIRRLFDTPGASQQLLANQLPLIIFSLRNAEREEASALHTGLASKLVKDFAETIVDRCGPDAVKAVLTGINQGQTPGRTIAVFNEIIASRSGLA